MEGRFFRNDVLDAVELESGWVFVRWVNNHIGYLSKSFIKTLKKLEQDIREKNLPGWFCESEKDHTTMHGIIEKFGCERFFVEDDRIYFRKFIGG